MLPESDPRVRLQKTAFVVYNHTDVEDSERFLTDFGLDVVERRDGTIFYGGYSNEPFCYISHVDKQEKSFGGAGYVVESREDLEKAIKIPGASQVEKFDAPGGGEIVSLKDPLGFNVFLVYGQENYERTPFEGQKLVVNYEEDKPRKGRFHRFENGRCPVYRWGHYGVTYTPGKYEEMFNWYSEYLALTPSDVVYKDGKPITCFFHIDRGEDYTDHHSFFFKPCKPGQSPDVAHSAYEVHDFDVQQIGHDYLAEKGYELCWGVGRHVLGSQVFDYWFDSDKFIVEHYADGDLVNRDTKVSHVEAAGKSTLAVWGPEVPPVF